jgi:hypothetical protein
VVDNGSGATIDEMDMFRGVVLVDLPEAAGTGRCTGTLIDCRHVLTAQHCLRPGSNEIQVGFVRHVPAREEAARISLELELGSNVHVRIPGKAPSGSSRRLFI